MPTHIPGRLEHSMSYKPAWAQEGRSCCTTSQHGENVTMECSALNGTFVSCPSPITQGSGNITNVGQIHCKSQKLGGGCYEIVFWTMPLYTQTYSSWGCSTDLIRPSQSTLKHRRGLMRSGWRLRSCQQLMSTGSQFCAEMWIWSINTLTMWEITKE